MPATPRPPSFTPGQRANLRRADRIASIVARYAAAYAHPDGDSADLVDLLVDLHHYADAMGRDLAADLDQARQHYLAELQEARR